MIVELDFGVAGSAYGTAMAQGGAILAVVLYQYSRPGVLRFRFTSVAHIFLKWREYLILGGTNQPDICGGFLIHSQYNLSIASLEYGQLRDQCGSLRDRDANYDVWLHAAFGNDLGATIYCGK